MAVRIGVMASPIQLPDEVADSLFAVSLKAGSLAFGDGVEIVRMSSIVGQTPHVDSRVVSELNECDVFLVIYSDTPDVNLLLGTFLAIGRPVIILIDVNDPAPSFPYKYSTYAASEFNSSTFISRLSALLESATDGTAEEEEEEEDRPRKVFVSYSHVDHAVLSRLMVHLRPLERSGRMDIWADTRLIPGDDWKAEVEAAIAECSMAVLIVSADFLASEFIINNELPEILAQAQSDGLRVISIVAQHCSFSRRGELSRFQAANDPSKPLASLPQYEQERVYDLVARTIEAAT